MKDKKYSFEKLKEQLKKLDKECPFIPHTNAGRLYSTVRRMKAEKELNIPIPFRSGSAISVKTEKASNKMAENEWNDFYKTLSENLKKNYPKTYKRLFLKGN